MEKILRSINGVYYTVYMSTILAAIAVFTLTFLNVNVPVINEKSATGITLSSILILYILITTPLAFWLFYKGSKKWQQMPDKFAKFAAYKKASITRLWVVGVGLIFGILLVYFMRSTNMIYCAGISAVALFLCKPSVNKMIKDLDLDEEDI